MAGMESFLNLFTHNDVHSMSRSILASLVREA